VVDLVKLPLEVLWPQRLQDDAGFLLGQLVEPIKLLDEAVDLLDQNIQVAGPGGGLYAPEVLGAVWDLVRRDLRAFQHLRCILGHGRVEVAPKGAQRRLAATLALQGRQCLPDVQSADQAVVRESQLPGMASAQGHETDRLSQPPAP